MRATECAKELGFIDLAMKLPSLATIESTDFSDGRREFKDCWYVKRCVLSEMKVGGAGATFGESMEPMTRAAEDDIRFDWRTTPNT